MAGTVTGFEQYVLEKMLKGMNIGGMLRLIYYDLQMARYFLCNKMS